MSDATSLQLQIIFLLITALTVISLIPWRVTRWERWSRLKRWIVVPVLVLAWWYERAMPSHFDIRVDLLFLLPMYVLVLIASARAWWRHRRGAG